MPTARPSRKDFRRVRAKDGEADRAEMADNEIRVIAARGQRNYISYAIDLLSGTGESKKKFDDVVITGMGAAVYNAVNIAEVVKRRVAGLHQTTDIASITVSDKYEPVAEDKEAVVVERKVSTITITLSTKQLDKKHIGYQAPLPAEEVTEQEDRPRPPRKPKAEKKPKEDKPAEEGAEKKKRGPKKAAAAAGEEKPAAKAEKPAGKKGGKKAEAAAAPAEEGDAKPARGARGGRRGAKKDDAADAKPAPAKKDDAPARGGRGGRGGAARTERGGRGGYSS